MKNKVLKGTIIIILIACIGLIIIYGANLYCGRKVTLPEELSIVNVAIPEWDGVNPSIEINNNIPFFIESDLITTSFEYYSELDSLGRCQTVCASIGPDLMPIEERGSIGMVKPTGWQSPLPKYDFIDGEYLYNRCHLIGFQLTGENDNICNLITGTRYFNVEGMLPWENKVASYIRKTGNHVLYRVNPDFRGNNLLANGVLIEAYSVEDSGRGVCFCVYCYNVQPYIEIDYSTGKANLE